MDRETVMELAQAAGLYMYWLDDQDPERDPVTYSWDGPTEELFERFAKVIEIHLKTQGYRQCAKGQRTTQFCGMLEQAALAEREACAMVAEAFGKTLEVDVGDCFAADIRSRT